MKKVLFSIILFLSIAEVWAIDTYNPANGQLTIPTVLVGEILYSNVVITIDSVVSVGKAPARGINDTYNPNLNQLLIPSVNVSGTTYFNVVIIAGTVLSVGGGLYQLPAITSNINESIAPPSLINTSNISGKISANNYTRNISFGDLNNDGCTDVVTAPSYYVNLPNLPIEIWRGDCKGNFINDTVSFISGPIPTTGLATAIFIADFQNNGQNGVLIVDSGEENLGLNSVGFSGGQNHLLLPINGKLVDVSNTNLPDNVLHYNHVSSIYGKPGKQQIVLTRMGGPLVGYGGIYILQNNGSGSFTLQDSKTLPAEFYPVSLLSSSPIDYIQPGTSTIAELNNDGQQYLITGTYSGGTSLSHTTAVFIYKQVSNSYIKIATIPIPAAYNKIGYSYGNTFISPTDNGLGVSGIVTGDFENSGRQDIAVIWEGSNKTYLQVIQNQGNDVFKDITETAVSGLKFQPFINSPVMQLQAKDVNGDGIPELILRAYQYPVSVLDNWSPVWQFKNGKFKYYDVFNGNNAQQVQSQLSLSNTDSLVNLFFEDIGNGKINIIGLETPTFFTNGPFTLTGSTVSHVLIHQ